MPATVLFADIRGYTRTTELLELPHVAELLGRFYENCATVIWERDGIINKLIGDAILAVFNFPIIRKDHVQVAVEAAVELQKKCADMKSTLPPEERERCKELGVGVGIHTGDVSFGEIGESIKDFTVIGGVVNLAARLQSAARHGEVVVTRTVYDEVRAAHPQAVGQTCQLKGIEKPVEAYVLPPVR